MTRDVVIVGGGIAGLSAAWRLRHRDVLLLEAGDRLGGRMRSDRWGDYWLNYGAHLFPAPGSLVDGMARECGLETVPVTGSMMGLAVGSTLLHSGRVESYPFRLPLSVRDRIAFARAGVKVQRAVARYRRVETAPRTSRTTARSASSSARSRPPCRDLLVRGAPRHRGAGRAVGRLRDRPVRTRVGRQALADRAQSARRERRAARGAGPRAGGGAHGLPRARDQAGRRRPGRAPRRRRGERAPRDRRRAGAARGAARRSGRRAGRRRAGGVDLRRVPERGGRDA